MSINIIRDHHSLIKGNLFYYEDKSVSLENTYTTCKIYTKLYPGPKWHIFYLHTSEDIDDIVSRFFHACLCSR